MKIITTTLEDFVNAEIKEWGFDYVDAQFASGYEPSLVNGIWCWNTPIEFLPAVIASTHTGDSKLSSPNNRARVLNPSEGL